MRRAGHENAVVLKDESVERARAIATRQLPRLRLDGCVVVGMKWTDGVRTPWREAGTRRLVAPALRPPWPVGGIAGRRGRWAAAMLFSAAVGHAAQQQPVVIERVDVSRVLIDVRVLGDEGEPMEGLGPDNFEVRIGGEPVDVESAQWLGADGRDGAFRPPDRRGAFLRSDEVEVWTGGEPVDVESAPWPEEDESGWVPLPSDDVEAWTGELGDLEPAWLDADEPDWAPLPSTDLTAALPSDDRGQLVVFFVQKSLEANRAVGLLRVLQDSDRLLAGVGPDDRVAVVSFEHHFKLWLDFTADLDCAREVLALDVMHEDPPVLEPQAGPSIVAGIDQAEGRKLWYVEDALRRLGEVLEPMRGPKSVVLIGYGFEHGFTRYNRALGALDAARAAVFSLDVTPSFGQFEPALRDLSRHTGGLFLTTHDPRLAVEQMATAVSGVRYVLFTRAPDLEPGPHAIDVELRGGGGRVLVRSTYVH